MTVSLAPAAAQDIEEIGDYIHAENPIAATRFIAELKARCARIAEAPRIGAPRPHLWLGLRSVVLKRYVIFYTLEGDAVRIERILHGSRDIDAIFDES